jgi:hypothetical protein
MSNIFRPEKDLYIVRRTSLYSSECPCEECIEVTVIKTVIHCKNDLFCHSPQSKDKYFNYRRINDVTLKDTMVTEWVATVPDLIDFIEKYGVCIISKNRAGYYELEIYDDSRE